MRYPELGLAVVLALAVGACTDGGEPGRATATTTPETTTTTVANPFCDATRQMASADPDLLTQAGRDAYQATVSQVAATAPPEGQADANALRTAFEQYLGNLGQFQGVVDNPARQQELAQQGQLLQAQIAPLLAQVSRLAAGICPGVTIPTITTPPSTAATTTTTSPP